MIREEREAAIMKVLRDGAASMPAFLTQCPGVSAITLRRDLARLESEGKLRRVHGGAVPVDMAPTPSVSVEQVEAFDALILPPVKGSWGHTLRQQSIRRRRLLIAESAPQVGGVYLGPRNYEESFKLGVFAAEQLNVSGGPVEMLLIALEGMQNTSERVEGFRAGFEKRFKGALTIHGVNGRGLLKEVIRQVGDAFEAFPRINVMFAVNDHTILAALEVAHKFNVHVSAYSVGGEGGSLYDELAKNGALRAVLALFPEVVGQAAIDRICASFGGERLDQAIVTPATILTPHSLRNYYTHGPNGWHIVSAVLEELSAPYRYSGEAGSNRSIGFMLHYPSHEWYRGLASAMRKRAAELGATLVSRNAEDEVAGEIRTIKQRIGAAAAKTIDHGETLLVDGGECSRYFAEALRALGRQADVYTNSLAVLEILAGAKGIRVFLTGGEFQAQSRTLVGPSVGTLLETIRVDRAILSPDGVSPAFGLSFEDERAALVCRRFCAAARKAAILADHGVVGLESRVQAARLGPNQTAFTDIGTLSAHRLDLSAAGIGVVVVDDEDEDRERMTTRQRAL
jgi:DeoR/GlpR family transcriptional regulator of sugar metabolism